MIVSGLEVGDLVKLRHPSSRFLKKLHIGVILKAPNEFSKSKLHEILWLTEDWLSVILMCEGIELKLLSAHEGNESRFAKYRKEHE